jgi:SAM-dependent methyltransferase
MADPSRSELFWAMLDPWLFLSLSLVHIPRTVARLVGTGNWAALLSPSRFRWAWFGDFWRTVSPEIYRRNEPHVVPLLQGRVRQGKLFPLPQQGGDKDAGRDGKGAMDVDVDVDVDADADGGRRFHPPVSGRVLEIGPGSGLWVDLFSAKHPPATTNETPASSAPDTATLRNRHAPTPTPTITHIYGVEPNSDVHPQLRERIRAAGLDGTYEIVPVGIDDLAASGAVQRGTIDCIVTIQCLCSITAPRHNIRELYTYLRPGGRWYVFEHVGCDKPAGLVRYQGEKHCAAALLCRMATR